MSRHPVADHVRARAAAPPALAGGQWAGAPFADSYRRTRAPNATELAEQLKNTAWTCASINASVCATFPPRLYVATEADQPAPKCRTKALARAAETRLRSAALPPRFTKAHQIREVTDHPLLALLAQVNPVHNAFDLWELTDLSLEVHGKAFWKLDFDALGTPEAVWPLPAQNVTPRRHPDSPNLIDSFEYRTGSRAAAFGPDEVIFFRFPDPRDPYLGGLSPLRACFESASYLSELFALKSSIMQNEALPGAVVSPAEVISEEERDRLEARWNQKFRRGGRGRVLFAESALSVSVLQQSLGDLAALAEAGATREDIANAFHVPISMLTKDTNLANLQAAEYQHAQVAVRPRLHRRDEKLNEQLVPLYDPTGRLFLWADDPVPLNYDYLQKQEKQDLQLGVTSINEVRADRGLPPAPWGDVPWLPDRWAPTDERHQPEASARASGADPNSA
jgi:HK97 family phage portal protein